ncbi:MAG TPA: acetolactate synthase [Nocardioidaceae bacterium]|nr:acetolactate synthase [Nocardioidaceae bacterium]
MTAEPSAAAAPRADCPATLEGHGGDFAVAVARAHGVQTLFTLSGAHVFPIYDGAVKAATPMRIVDVRHEQTAVFAAEATGKLTRTPGFAALTAGPGVTNGVSAITQARFNGSPLVVLGGRAPTHRWGMGSLQELDQPPILSTVTKLAETVHLIADLPGKVDEAFRIAASPHRGPTFLDVPMDQLFSRADLALPATPQRSRLEPDPQPVADVAARLSAATRPVLVLGTDVWADGAEDAALRLVDTFGLPVVTNGMGRGVVPAGHPQLVSRARGLAFGRCDLAVVVGTPLDFRLGYGRFGGRDGAPEAQVVHLADAADQIAAHATLAAAVDGDLSLVLDALGGALERQRRRPDWSGWVAELQGSHARVAAADAELLHSDAAPIHPARVYGELLPRLADDAVIIGDGGDFVSFAGRLVEPRRPGCWLDPGPYGCLGAGLGAAIAARIARPSAQVVLLLGDGAAGLSLMDVDTLVRHRLPVAIVVGNNSSWGLEKHPMHMLYGYDVAADLAPGTAYDAVARALGGAGETVTEPADLGPALDRALAAGCPYLVNVITDPAVAYPRSTTGV